MGAHRSGNYRGRKPKITDDALIGTIRAFTAENQRHPLQSELASWVGIARSSMGLKVHRLVAEGRLRQIAFQDGSKRRGIALPAGAS